jgi:malonyl-CoA O-methyltransferase
MSWFSQKKIKTLSPLEGYNKWASSYKQESNPVKNLSDDLVKKFFPSLTGKHFLDCGCGTGYLCSVASENGAAKIVGIDLSPAMIEVAKQSCPAGEFKCADITSTQFSDSQFDVIVCALVLAHLQDIKVALKNLVTSLKTDGVLIITDFHPYLTMNGAKRTFTDKNSGEKFEVGHYLHHFETYFSFFHQNKMVVEILEEPQYNNSPVIFGLKVRKQ